jgi:hypothetical protein
MSEIFLFVLVPSSVELSAYECICLFQVDAVREELKTADNPLRAKQQNGSRSRGALCLIMISFWVVLGVPRGIKSSDPPGRQP